MAEWEIVQGDFEGFRPQPGQTGRSTLSGLRGGTTSLVLDAGILYANANLEALKVYPRTLTEMLMTSWVDAQGGIVEPKLLGETRGIRHGNGLSPNCRG